jgi:hypothetical protein
MPCPKSAASIMSNDIHELGMTLLQADKVSEAAFQFRKALSLEPGFADASLCLGHCLHLLRKFDEAVEVYDRAIHISPEIVTVWNNRGNALLELCRYDQAAESYSQALELAPGLHDARVALATCYQAQGQFAKALTACDTVLKADPENAEAHWNRALLLLLNGNYHEGWQEYEWRWRKRNFTSPRRNFPRPLWRGEPLAGRTILIHAEQGFGDTLQFCRYVPLVAAHGARVIFECHPPLAPLMRMLEGVASVVPMGEPLPPFDLHVPLLSLPMIFDTTVGTIPNQVPYLAPPVDRLSFWRGLVPDEGRMKVGLCWAGKSYPDPGRSCTAALLASLAAVAGISWYSLQIGWQEELPLQMTDCTGHIRDFGNTAALIAQLDLVITVDTAVAHLAGALGKPTWVMLPYAPDWRWLLGRNDSPWYPATRLFRQTVPGDWEDVMRRIVCALKSRFPGKMNSDGS